MTNTPKFDLSRQAARSLDSADELRHFRNEFFVPEPDLIYMDGNSLGRMPVRSAGRLEEIVRQEWGARLIRSWGEGWYDTPVRIGEKIARLVGADSGQVIVSDSTSVNLFKLVLSALALRPDRSKIVTDNFNFPSDLYILQGCVRLLGGRRALRVVPSQDRVQPDLAALYAAIDEDTALVTLSHVAFKSGYMYDAAAIARRAHAAGALVLWDLSHSAGSVPVDLDAWESDLAIGCTYKYLNGGPGAPAFLYVRQSLQNEAFSPIWGWFGNAVPFKFDLEYAPAPGIRRFLIGTPPILSMLAIEPGVDLLLEVGLDRLRRKSIALTSYLIDLFDACLAPLGFELGSPRQADRRGSHVSIRHPEGYRINRALIEEMNVLPDFREPDNIRLGLAPLYTSFEDVYEAVDRIRRAVVETRYLHFPQSRLSIT
ncbi:MAG TPA: kynureninase [Anaerolineaceae bacterium]|nr:kynureninase [Anaerolineaceae bacterium]